MTKYFICINKIYYIIYLQNIKFVSSILWPEGAYTYAAHAAKAKIMIQYSDEIMNHDYIGSLGCIPNEPKSVALCRNLPLALVQCRSYSAAIPFATVADICCCLVGPKSKITTDILY